MNDLEQKFLQEVTEKAAEAKLVCGWDGAHFLAFLQKRGPARAMAEQARRGAVSEAFDRLAALQSHLAALEAERTRLDTLIQSVRDTIRCEERKEIMSDEQKFEALKQQVLTRYEQVYGQEAREKYGDDMVGAAQSALRDLTVEQYREWTGLGQEIQARLEAAVRAGLSPEGEEGKAITALHRRWLTITGNRYEPDKHRGIAELYVDDPRFTAYYDKAVPGCARFLRDAVVRWAK